MVASPGHAVRADGTDRIRLTDPCRSVSFIAPRRDGIHVFGDGVTQTHRQYRWTTSAPPAQETVQRLMDDLRIPEPIARVLLYRGVDTSGKARQYFRPDIGQLHDPFLMDGMERAVTRVQRAMEGKERLFVFGDYDVDGTNGASMLYLFFRELGIEADFYTPDRIKEGYGISRQGIDRAHQQGVTLFIAIDCGITAVDQVAYANSLGLDVIICDHHCIVSNVTEHGGGPG